MTVSLIVTSNTGNFALLADLTGARKRWINDWKQPAEYTSLTGKEENQS